MADLDPYTHYFHNELLWHYHPEHGGLVLPPDLQRQIEQGLWDQELKILAGHNLIQVKEVTA